MTDLWTKDWRNLPDDVILHIFTYLNSKEKYNAALVCNSWQNCHHNPLLWRNFVFRFMTPADDQLSVPWYVQCIRKHGPHFRTVQLVLDQAFIENRQKGCRVLEMLSKIPNRRLMSLKVIFMGENPLFYAGIEFVDAFKELFGPTPKNIDPPISNLLRIDLGGLPVQYDDSVLNIIADNLPDLNFLNILNRLLVCKISPECLLNLVVKCKKLEDLRALHCSMSDDILLALAEKDRVPLKNLAILCRREEKYGKDLSSEAWSKLANSNPALRVTLGFDHTCPLNLVSVIMKPEIPVKTLHLETFTRIYDEVGLAAHYYKNTLEKLVLQTRNSDELGRALVRLAGNCKLLKSLFVYCVLDKEVVDEILHVLPDMKESESYILKWQSEPEPWIVGSEEEQVWAPGYSQEPNLF